MANQTGYESRCVGGTPNSTCQVVCADGYTGDATQYKCQITSGGPSYVPEGIIAQCVSLLYVAERL